MHQAPEGYGCGSCCVLMCEALVFSVMLIRVSLLCRLVSASVTYTHLYSSFAFFSPFGVDDQRE